MSTMAFATMPPASSEAMLLFAECQRKNPSQSDLVLLCITNGLSQQWAAQVANTKLWLVILAGALVFLMQLGFAALSAGSVRRKNLSNTLLKNILDVCVAGVAFYAVGWAFAFGSDNSASGHTFIGTAQFFLVGNNIDYALWFFQFALCAVSVTILAGTSEERCRMEASILYSVFMASFVYPVVVHSFWSENGFLSPTSASPMFGVGAIDFAGSGVVHLTGGICALVSSIILGARKGRFHDEKGDLLQRPATIPGHSVSLQVMGCFILWFGWYGFNSGPSLLLPNATNSGSIAALAVVNTSLGAATGALSALLTNMYLTNRSGGEMAFDLSKTLNGSLAGAVAISAGCGVLEPWATCFVGIIAGWVYLGCSALLIRFRIDDTVDAIPVHMACGIWGVFAVGWLASPGRLQAAYGNDDHIGLFYSIGQGRIDGTLLGNQTIAILFVVSWCIALMFPFLWVLNYFGWLRVDDLEEIAGLDTRYHHATQEDDGQLKHAIMKEFQKYKTTREKKRKEEADKANLKSRTETKEAIEGSDIDEDD